MHSISIFGICACGPYVYVHRRKNASSTMKHTMRHEVTVGLVIVHMPPLCRWRALVCKELLEAHALPPSQLSALYSLRRIVKAWRHNVRTPRPRFNSWHHRRLHRLEEPILIT